MEKEAEELKVKEAEKPIKWRRRQKNLRWRRRSNKMKKGPTSDEDCQGAKHSILHLDTQDLGFKFHLKMGTFIAHYLHRYIIIISLAI